MPRLGSRLSAWQHVFHHDRINHFNGYELLNQTGGMRPSKTIIGFRPVVQSDAGSTDEIVINLGGKESLVYDEAPTQQYGDGYAPSPRTGRVDAMQIVTSSEDVSAAAHALLPRGSRLTAEDGNARSGCHATIWTGPSPFPWRKAKLRYVVVHYTSVIWSGTDGPITFVSVSGTTQATSFC